MIVAVLWFLAAAAMELLSARIRRWSVERLIVPGTKALWVWVVAGLVLRLALTGLVLLGAFRSSLVAGGAALLGYWLCRWATIWWIDRVVYPQR
jgi:hypothetical protein